jgi:phosphatidylglycerophosphate synthase
VTLVRAFLAVVLAGFVAVSLDHPISVAALVSISTVALVLDAVDGWVARWTGTVTPLGARFDTETDAFLILVLSSYVANSVGTWVLAIGAARYVFLAARCWLPWLRSSVPPSYWRKFVAATQGVVLTVAASDVLPGWATVAVLAGALALLAVSFTTEARWLWRHQAGAVGKHVALPRIPAHVPVN